jgi:hypothetical protein
VKREEEEKRNFWRREEEGCTIEGRVHKLGERAHFEKEGALSKEEGAHLSEGAQAKRKGAS